MCSACRGLEVEARFGTLLFKGQASSLFDTSVRESLVVPHICQGSIPPGGPNDKVVLEAGSLAWSVKAGRIPAKSQTWGATSRSQNQCTSIYCKWRAALHS